MQYNIARAIKRVRQDADLTLRAVGKLSGVKFQRIHQYEKGELVPTIENARRISEACGVSIIRLFKIAEVGGNNGNKDVRDKG